MWREGRQQELQELFLCREVYGGELHLGEAGEGNDVEGGKIHY